MKRPAVAGVFLLCNLTTVIGSAIFCSQCDSDTNPHCIDNPPAPQNCTSCERFDPETAGCVSYIPLLYCQIERRYINTTLIRLRRDCIPAMMRTTCQTVLEHGEEIRVCFETCKTHGCNLNSAMMLRALTPSYVILLICFISICNIVIWIGT